MRADLFRPMARGRLSTCQAALLILCSCLLSSADGQVRSGTVRLEGAINPRIRLEDDRGPVEGNKRLPYITISFGRTVEKHAALDRLLEEQQDPSSANYHKWLTPEQFADPFGIETDDLSSVAAWLQAEGFTVEATARSRSWIAFSGTRLSPIRFRRLLGGLARFRS
jgi:hypothetical protein